MALAIKKYPTERLLTVEKMLIKWLSQQNSKGKFFFYNHNLEDCKDWIESTFKRTHNVSTIERAFRQIREDKKVQSRDASLPASAEKRWYVISSLK
ncbi:MAG: hypothetical protein CMI54_07245 [Parcubacteria group bacterium]|jgi:hypothetical protein|nr:hypothetical protein [Parcubacteria group bacterium]|tara:strand:+ start:7679 stop:7966 length:288 start_codon:yes stop_codon:yes gene_type:complete